MEFDARELIVIELALILRKQFLEKNLRNLPRAVERLVETETLLSKIRKVPIDAAADS